jgi:uncharacterized protein YbjT (DUF2867 family)
MKTVLFGATGMIGQGVLRECLLDPAVTSVLIVGRSHTGVSSPKVTELIVADLADLSSVEAQLSGQDAVMFCLGISSVGMSETAYRHVTYDMAVNAGKLFASVSPGSKFLYISGAGTDSSAAGRVMWARVKGETENALLSLPLDAYMLRPGIIQPQHGIKSKTRAYRIGYAIARPLYPLLRRLAPGLMTSTSELGKAMIRIAREGAPKRVLETKDLNALGT